MKLSVNKCFKLETDNGDVGHITYDEAKELYVELHKEFGELSESWVENKLHYPTGVRQDTSFGSVPTTGYVTVQRR